MSETHVTAELRRLVASRAGTLCEYCLVHEDDTLFGCQVDHIISEKHGGPTVAENLAYACASCNRRKGSDVGSIARPSGAFLRFFNRRVDRWADHFRLDGVVIESLTEIGEVTCRILAFNDTDRLQERRALAASGRYPNPSAFEHIREREGPTSGP